MRRITVSCLTLALILLGLTGLAAAQNVTIQLTPQGMPIQIPATGGSFNYTIAATNNGTTPQRTTVWCMITLPNGNPYGPVLGPARIILSPGQMIERQRTQAIPAGFSAGNYSFNGYVGVYSDSIWDSDSFSFEKLDNGGAELWVARYNGPGNGEDLANAIAVDDEGSIYVTGYSFAYGTYADYATVKYDASGNQIWMARYNGPGNHIDIAFSIALDGSGNAYVTGTSYGSGPYEDYATVKYDASGNQIWVARYNGPGNNWDAANSLALDCSGNVYVTGFSVGSETSADYATTKYDASGNQIWAAHYNGPGNGYDYASSLALDGNGSAYVTGYSVGSATDYDYATVKYDASGSQIWAARYDGPGNGSDQAFSIALDESSNAYVTGWSHGGSGDYDYASIKYNASGNQIWAARYDGPGNANDQAMALALDKGDNVYVTGGSWDNGTGFDFCTIKYSGGNPTVVGPDWLPVEAAVLGQPLPQEFALHQNYPNPFNASTVLRYKMQEARYVSLKVYDTAGRLVETLVDGWRSAGVHELTWEVGDLPSGMYFARLEAGDYVGVQKLILLK